MQLERIMDYRSMVRILIILTISASMIAIVSTGLWLLHEPSEMCLLGNTGEGSAEFTSIVYIVAGSSLIIAVVYLFWSMPSHLNKWSCNSNQRRLFVVTLFGLQLVLLILFASLYALTQSTVGFASLQRWVASPERWVKIADCLHQESKVCVDFERKYGGDTLDQFLGRHLTSIESGCCKPPIECDFNYWSPTKWIKPENDTYSNFDCYEWENDSKKLCYNCQACKLGYSQDLKKAWTISGATIIISLLIFALGFMLPIHLLASDQEPLLS